MSKYRRHRGPVFAARCYASAAYVVFLNNVSLPKIISKCCELVKLYVILIAGVRFFETQCS